MKPKSHTSDPDILGSLPAMLRAARKARKLAYATGTPFYVMKNGKIVNLNPKPKRRNKPRK